MTTMRAKMQVDSVQVHGTNSETLSMRAVCASQYPADGSDENNTFAKWTPTANLSISITNPALCGQFKVGDQYYVDFTPAGA